MLRKVAGVSLLPQVLSLKCAAGLPLLSQLLFHTGLFLFLFLLGGRLCFVCLWCPFFVWAVAELGVVGVLRLARAFFILRVEVIQIGPKIKISLASQSQPAPRLDFWGIGSRFRWDSLRFWIFIWFNLLHLSPLLNLA
jgi:hypothetical protein